MKHSIQYGQSLVEILFAIAIFTIGVVTIGYLIFDSFTSLSLREDALRARLYAKEALEVARLLSATSFESLPEGSYGLQYANETWTLFDAQEGVGKFTRTLSITNEADDLKLVRAIVSWEAYGFSRSAMLETYISDWRGTHGDAKDVFIDTNNASLGASSTLLDGIAPLNTGGQDVVVTGMEVQWEASALLERIAIRGNPVFTASTTKIASGEYIDIDDYVIGAATGYHLMDFVFDGAVTDTDFIITLIFSDNTERHAVIDLVP